MNELKIFENEKFGKIRTIIIDGEPWFVGKDVATALGYSNTNDALKRHVKPKNKQQGDGVAFLDPIGRLQNPLVINKSGVISLLLSSKLKEAEEFQDWILDDVIPSIAQTGYYIAGVDKDLVDPQLNALCEVVHALMIQDVEQKRQAARLAELDNQVSQFKDDLTQKLGEIKSLIGTHPDNWREDCRKLIAKMAYRDGGPQNIAAVNTLVYAQVNSRAGVNLNTRLNNYKKRALQNGASKTAVDKLNIVDVIAQDKKLIEIYVKVVREMAAQYDYE